jgi:hypothetical protein
MWSTDTKQTTYKQYIDICSIVSDVHTETQATTWIRAYFATQFVLILKIMQIILQHISLYMEQKDINNLKSLNCVHEKPLACIIKYLKNMVTKIDLHSAPKVSNINR